MPSKQGAWTLPLPSQACFMASWPFPLRSVCPQPLHKDSLALIRHICSSVLHLTSKHRAESCAGVQVPTGGESASPADQALYDAMARALLGERPDAQAIGLGAQLLPPEQLPRMLHYLLGTQLRRHLER